MSSQNKEEIVSLEALEALEDSPMDDLFADELDVRHNAEALCIGISSLGTISTTPGACVCTLSTYCTKYNTEVA